MLDMFTVLDEDIVSSEDGPHKTDRWRLAWKHKFYENFTWSISYFYCGESKTGIDPKKGNKIMLW